MPRVRKHTPAPLGRRVHAARIYAGFDTPRDLAKACGNLKGFSASVISNMETGFQPYPKLMTEEEVANVVAQATNFPKTLLLYGTYTDEPMSLEDQFRMLKALVARVEVEALARNPSSRSPRADSQP